MVYSINRLSYVQQHVLSTTTNTFLQPRRFVTFFFVMREAFFFLSCVKPSVSSGSLFQGLMFS